jgi:hypothetical protein
MTACNLTIRYKVSPRLMKMYLYIVDMAEGVKYFIIMLSELVLPCANDVDTNHTEGRTKMSVKNITLTLLG